MTKYFLDTNILIYCLDEYDKKKQNKARQTIKKSQEKDTFVISTQVIQEFYITATKKLKLEPLIVKNIMHSFQFEVVIIDQFLIDSAIDISILNQISFWDSLIIAAAQSARCSQLFTEDLNPNQKINGIKIINPFN